MKILPINRYVSPNWLIIVLIFSFVLLLSGSTLAASNSRQLSFMPYPSSFFPPSTVYTLRAEGPLVAGTGRLASTEDGAKLYQQWCSTCHGDEGQGLTAEWRAEWPEGKQNCWQSKCHAANHPPDGFSFPEQVPALIGPEALTKFKTAKDIYVYSRATMPYWSPNLLDDEEYLAITTFLVEANLAERKRVPPPAWPNDLSAVSLRSTELTEPWLNQIAEAILASWDYLW
jgi:mono/diheme cytochrome c family protein